MTKDSEKKKKRISSKLWVYVIVLAVIPEVLALRSDGWLTLETPSLQYVHGGQFSFDKTKLFYNIPHRCYTTVSYEKKNLYSWGAK